MNRLRRAVSRKEGLLALLLFVLAGGWLGWQRLGPPAIAQVTADPLLLEEQVLEPAASLAPALLDPSVLGGNESARLLVAGQAEACLQAAEGESIHGATAADRAAALAIKAVLLVHRPAADLAAARDAADQALAEGQADPAAGMLARVASGAVLRRELDAGAPSAERIGELRQLLQSLPAGPPAAPVLNRFWRGGLALRIDAAVLAAETGDPAGEAEALRLLQQQVPEDVYAGRFPIPGRAAHTARQILPAGGLDDHSRAAMLTAAAALYIDVGDRLHADRLLRKAIEAHGRLLEECDTWQGEQGDTVTPKGRFKKVGSEFYTYRGAMERLAKYSADWWGIRVVRQEVPLQEALASCDQKLFRAIVRVRADAVVDPIRILHDERIRPLDYLTVADWFAKRPYDPQGAWEQQRAGEIERIGGQELAALDALASGRRLVEQGRHDDAVAMVSAALQAEPELLETGVTLRCEIADALLRAKRPAEAGPVLDAALELAGREDPRLGRAAERMKGRILFYKMSAARQAADLPQAIALGEQIVADAAMPLSVRLSALRHLVRFHDASHRSDKALAAYARLAAFGVEKAGEPMRDAFVADAAGYLRRQGLLASATQPASGASTQPIPTCCGN